MKSLIIIKSGFKQVLNILIFILVIASCNNDEELTMGDNFIDKTTQIMSVDTFSLELSTIVLDSLITSNTEIILAGYYEDGEFGKISAKSFFQLGLPVKTSINIEEEDEFDSITLVLPYDSYTYGDTTKMQYLEVYKLIEPMYRNDGDDFYNTSRSPTELIPIGSINYYPKPSTDSIVEIRVEDELGIDLLSKLRNDTEEVYSNSTFQNYIYGFAIVPDTTYSNSIIAFDESNLNFNLYTSRKSENVDEEDEQIIYSFPSSGYQYNQIISDRSGTVLKDLNSSDDLISSLTNNRAYIQAGVGILTKVRFPYLNMLILDKSKLILSAELVLKPEIESYESEFPELLYLWETNEYNEFDINEDDNILSASVFTLDEMYHLDTYYTFSVIDFLQEQIDNNYIDNDKAVIVSIPPTNFSSTLERVVFSSSYDLEKKPKLIIKYIEI